MTFYRWSAEGGTDSVPVSVANSAASGTAITTLVISGSSTPAGSSVVQYKSAAAVFGSMGVEIAPATTGTTYMRWDETSPTDTRGGLRCGVQLSGTPGATTVIGSIMNSSNSIMGEVRVSAAGVMYIADASGVITASNYTLPVITDKYVVEAFATNGSTTANGRVELYIYDVTGTTLLNGSGSGYDSGTAKNTGTTQAQRYRFGGVSTTNGVSYVRYDDINFGSAPSGTFFGNPGTDATVVSPSVLVACFAKAPAVSAGGSVVVPAKTVFTLAMAPIPGVAGETFVPTSGTPMTRTMAAAPTVTATGNPTVTAPPTLTYAYAAAPVPTTVRVATTASPVALTSIIAAPPVPSAEQPVTAPVTLTRTLVAPPAFTTFIDAGATSPAVFTRLMTQPPVVGLGANPQAVAAITSTLVPVPGGGAGTSVTVTSVLVFTRAPAPAATGDATLTAPRAQTGTVLLAPAISAGARITAPAVTTSTIVHATGGTLAPPVARQLSAGRTTRTMTVG